MPADYKENPTSSQLEKMESRITEIFGLSSPTAEELHELNNLLHVIYSHYRAFDDKERPQRKRKAKR